MAVSVTVTSRYLPSRRKRTRILSPTLWLLTTWCRCVWSTIRVSSMLTITSSAFRPARSAPLPGTTAVTSTPSTAGRNWMPM